MCMQCIAACPNGVLRASVGLDVTAQEKWIIHK
jgi:epoxyqueuosine reductase QueG